jgi:hypothetical protein
VGEAEEGFKKRLASLPLDGVFMDHLEYPSKELWQKRRSWFEACAEPSDDGGYLVSEQACALAADLQSAFCAGAWIAVIVMAAAAIDAHLRDVEDATGSAASAIDNAGGDPQLHQLRKRRNSLMHLSRSAPAITVEQQWSDRDQLEEDARLAVELVFRTFYTNPSV